MTRYWIVFKDADQWYLRWMKPGFRHCFIQGCVNGLWFSLDLRGETIEVKVDFMVEWTENFVPDNPDYIKSRYDFAIVEKEHEWRGLGYTAVPAPARGNEWCLLGVLSCVGMAKRFLGIGAPWILTPAQLHRYLTKNPV